jgi:hypothetical protein
VAAFQAEMYKMRAYRKYGSQVDVYFMGTNVVDVEETVLTEKEHI